jgi:glycolate dehydrogenase iron-sulfur subunit
MAAVADGVATVDSKFEQIIDFCLGCRACEPVCPGMVPYGSLLEGSRAEIVAQRSTIARRFRGLVVGRLIGSRTFMVVVTLFVRMIQVLRLKAIVPSRFRRALQGMRTLRSGRAPYPTVADSSGEKIGLLTGCIQDQWFPEVNQAAFRLLTLAGYVVDVPNGQTCCGALAAHDGHADRSEALLNANRRAFDDTELVVATAAGCSAHLADNFENATDITVLVARAIAEGRLPTLSPQGVDIVVQDPCHLRHAQRVVDAPREIVKAAGYGVVELDDAGMCCGAAGLYTVLQPEASTELGELKAGLIRATGVVRVVSANPGCEMQLRSCLGDGYQISHPIELYLEAIDAADGSTIVPTVETQA